jgi:serine/threonine protein kinase
VAVLEAVLSAQFDRVTPLVTAGNSLVFSGVQRSLGRTVAIKVFPQQVMLLDPSQVPEVRAHAALSWHPNIATLFDAGTTPAHQLWMAIEFAPATLDGRLRRHPIDPVELLGIARELVDAVVTIHAAGMVHCDLKPSNVLLAEDGGVRVTDFGIARVAGRTPPTLDIAQGTLQYIAPEVLEGNCPQPSADVWGVGATLWAAVHGRAPFGGDGAHFGAVIASAIGGVPEWSAPESFSGPEADWLRHLIEMCLERDPSERPTALELQRLLERPIRRVAPPAPVAPTSPNRTSIGIAAALAALALVAVGVSQREVLDSSGERLVGNVRQWCAMSSKVQRNVAQALNTAAATIDNGKLSATAVRNALGELPGAVAVAVQPGREMMLSEPSLFSLNSQLSEAAIRRFLIADTIDYMATGEYLHDTAAESTPTTPVAAGELGATSAAFAELTSISEQNCGTNGEPWRSSQTRLIDTLRRSVEGPNAPFFADPASADALEPAVFEIAIQRRPEYFASIVNQQPQWLIGMLSWRSRNPLVTRILLGDGAGIVRQAALLSPDVAAFLLDTQPVLTQVSREMSPDAVTVFQLQLSRIAGRA